MSSDFLRLARGQPLLSRTSAMVFPPLPAPSITSVTPSNGADTGGTSVLVAGLNFRTGATVSFGGTPATGVNVLGSMLLSCNTPAHAVGAVTVSVTNPDGQSGILANAFTYTSAVVAPTIASLNFALGDPAGGGLSITATGTSLDAVTVTIGGNSATITAQSPTSVTVTLPAHAAGTVSFVATNIAGSASSSFEYWSPVQISSIVAVWDAEKGITNSSGVTAWVDQTGNGHDLAESSAKFTYTATAFGTLHGLTSDGSKQLLTSRTVQNLGRSLFWVAKYTSSKSTRVDYTGNAPLTVIGDASGSVNNNAGHDAGQLCYMNYDGVTPWAATTRGSSLNDGTPRLYGFTHSLAGDVKTYVGTSQQGATNTSQTYDTTAAAFNAIGQGFGGNTDGFVGTIGAALVVNAIISGSDLTKLNAWSQQRWGTP